MSREMPKNKPRDFKKEANENKALGNMLDFITFSRHTPNMIEVHMPFLKDFKLYAVTTKKIRSRGYVLYFIRDPKMSSDHKVFELKECNYDRI